MEQIKHHARLKLKGKFTICIISLGGLWQSMCYFLHGLCRVVEVQQR
jgi:hypothetical protein